MSDNDSFNITGTTTGTTTGVGSGYFTTESSSGDIYYTPGGGGPGSAGSVFVSGGGTGSSQWVDAALSGGSNQLIVQVGPFTIVGLDSGDVKVVTEFGGKEKEFHISVAKVMELLYNAAHLVIEEPEEDV